MKSTALIVSLLFASTAHAYSRTYCNEVVGIVYKCSRGCTGPETCVPIGACPSVYDPSTETTVESAPGPDESKGIETCK